MTTLKAGDEVKHTKGRAFTGVVVEVEDNIATVRVEGQLLRIDVHYLAKT